MHDPSEAAPAPRPATRGGPRHAAPDDVPATPPVAVPSRSPGPSAGGRAAHRRRRAAPVSAAPASRRGRWLALVTAVVAVAAVLVVGLVRDDDGTAPGTAAATAPDRAPAALVDWVGSELPDGGTVAVPPELREELLRAGVDAAVLPESPPPDAAEPGTPALALVETAPQGGRLLARFERGAGAPPLLLVDPAPVEPTEEQRGRRQALAAAVLANPTTRADGDARAVLAAADVDARLLSLIAALTAREGVGLWEFPTLSGEQPGAAPARRVVVDAVGGQPVPADGAATQRLVAWLDAQLAPFAPDVVEVTGDGVLIAFDYVPGPDAVVAAAAP